MLKKCVCIVSVLFLVVLVFFSLGGDEIPYEEGSIAVYFCPQDDCEVILVETLEKSTSSIHCAFYDLDLLPILNVLDEKDRMGVDVSVVVDADYRDGLDGYDFIFFDTRSAYMHNKFCIVDEEIVVTGSMNPTTNGVSKNANNLVVIESRYLATNYGEEFASFVSGNFGRDETVVYSQVNLSGVLVENYFCPEDECEERILAVLDSAQESIYFMQFSFTSDAIGDLLLEKHIQSVEIMGLFEKQQNSQWSEYHNLLDAGVNVSYAQNNGKLHHKVFIVDEEIVIFGSMNPSKNGNENNDENIVIVYDASYAALFIKEFNNLSN